jgi:peptidoglycan hydrolase-like protein with peptidoglycan-binding domain
MEKFVDLTIERFNHGVWNNGTWGPRDQNRSGKPQPSVHGTGRAADISWRRDAVWNGTKISRSSRGFNDYQQALQVVDFWVANADLFLIEEIHDYRPSPWGRGWRCSRNAWKSYQTSTIGNGAPGGDWFHVEIAPTHADDTSYYQEAFARAGGGSVAPTVPSGTAPSSGGGVATLIAPPGNPELTRANEAVVNSSVRQLQEILIRQDWAVFTNPDGRYGNATWKSVKAMQVALGFTGGAVDGRYGPNTAARLAAHLAALG